MAKPSARLNPYLRDGAIVAALGALTFVPGMSFRGLALDEVAIRPWDALGVLLALLGSVPLVARTRWPGQALVVVGLSWTTSQALGYGVTPLSLTLILVLYTAGLTLGRRRWQVAAVAGYAILIVLLILRGTGQSPIDMLFFGLVLALFWASGAWMRRHRALQVEAERARIARELHDVVTHHVTAMVVQADAAQYTPDPDLSVISDTGRLALTELRNLLDVLHAAPDLRIQKLVEGARASGQQVTLIEEGSPALLAAGAELAAYRVVQEGLTNALKHAPGRKVQVTARYRATATDLEVLTAPPPTTNAPSPGRTAPADAPSPLGPSDSGPSETSSSSTNPADPGLSPSPSPTLTSSDLSPSSPNPADLSLSSPSHADLSPSPPSHADLSPPSPSPADLSLSSPSHADLGPSSPSHADLSLSSPSHADLGLSSAPSSSPLPDKSDLSGLGGGHGLAGLLERVEGFGGTVEAGAVPGGGYRLFARIPAKGGGLPGSRIFSKGRR